MEETPLRQPRTFWQWLSGQPGTLWVPPPPPVITVDPPRSALDAIEAELYRLHSTLSDLTEEISFDHDSAAYLKVVETMSKLHEEMVRRSKEDSTNK